jgi:hypothetical protein
VATLTAPNTRIASWHLCGMKVRVETAPPFLAAETIVIFGTDFSATSPRFIIGPAFRRIVSQLAAQHI